MRCFIAVDISSEVRARIERLQEQLQADLKLKTSDVKWVEPENMHLTLKFIGEVPDSDLAMLCRTVAEAASRHHVFDLGLAKVGTFGGHSARVVWVGCTLGLTELCELAADIENELENAGWPRESREFSGHLTVCRVKNFVAGKKIYQAASKLFDFDAGVTHIDAVHVYQSRLFAKGSEYTKISTQKLNEL